MSLFCTCAFICGWLFAPLCAQCLLAIRWYRSGMCAQPATAEGGLQIGGGAPTLPDERRIDVTPFIRCLCGAFLGLYAVAAWGLMPPVVCVFATLGAGIMLVVLICDCHTQIIPWELCAGLGICGTVLQVVCFHAVMVAIAAGVVCTGIPILCNRRTKAQGKLDAVGTGDIRMMVPLCLCSAPAGVIEGAIGCAAVLGGSALTDFVIHSGFSQSHIPAAPSLCIWFLIGTVANFL